MFEKKKACIQNEYLFFCSFNHRNEYYAPAQFCDDGNLFFMQLFVESKMKWGFHSFRFIIRVEGVLASIELLTSGQFLFRQPVSAVSEMK